MTIVSKLAHMSQAMLTIIASAEIRPNRKYTRSWSRIPERTISLRFHRHNPGSSQTWGFRIQCLHYKPVSNHFCSKGGRELNTFVDVTVNSKEENPEDFCPNYVQEFGLWWQLGQGVGIREIPRGGNVIHLHSCIFYIIHEMFFFH